jgi:hypothetical protein
MIPEVYKSQIEEVRDLVVKLLGKGISTGAESPNGQKSKE